MDSRRFLAPGGVLDQIVRQIIEQVLIPGAVGHHIDGMYDSPSEEPLPKAIYDRAGKTAVFRVGDEAGELLQPFGFGRRGVDRAQFRPEKTRLGLLAGGAHRRAMVAIGAEPTDAVAGKRTLAVRLGDPRTRVFYTGLVVVGLGGALAAAAVGRPWALLAVAALPAALGPVRAVRSGASGRALLPRRTSTRCWSATGPAGQPQTARESGQDRGCG